MCCLFFVVVVLLQWNEIREQMFGTTVALQLNQGTHPGSGGNRSREPFLGTFLGEQKGTNINIRFRNQRK